MKKVLKPKVNEKNALKPKLNKIITSFKEVKIIIITSFDL